MNKICTSIEQSRKLIELGLPVDTADMWWNIDIVDKFGIDSYSDIPSCCNVSDTDIPAWSLSALFELLPSAFKSNSRHYCLKIGKLANEVEWFISYEWEGWTFQIMKGTLDTAVFGMVCWLLETKRI